MWRYNNTDELYHWGILGMKWGVRRYQNKDGSLTPEGKRRQNSRDYNEVQRIKSRRKNVKQMSNDELRKVNERQRLESQYRQNNSKTRYIAKGIAIIGTTALLARNVDTLYDKGTKIVSIGRKAINKIRYR